MIRVRYRIKALAEERGMPLTVLAREAELDQSRLYNIANGKASDVKMSTLQVLARVLEVPVTDLIEEYDDGGPISAAS